MLEFDDYIFQQDSMDMLSSIYINSSMNYSGYRNDTTKNYDNGNLYEDQLYDPPAGLIALLSFFYGSISILAVVGNFLVMWIVATSKRMQNVTNCFIANLALADIVIGLFTIPFQFQAALLQRWNFPAFMCPFCPFVQMLSVNVSVFTLTAIAVDRHRAILYPLSARPSKRFAKIIIGGIWLLGFAFATPMVIALRVDMVDDIDTSTGKVSTKPFCSPINMSERSMVIYRAVLLFLQYIIPLCVISFVYARMAIRLWGSRAPGNAQDTRDANLIRNKKKVIKMLVIVVAIFAVCWLPLHTYQVLQTCFPEVNEYRYINIIFFCCDWLAMSNSCYNPFIYGIYNEKFKREFKQRFPCCGRRNNALPMDSCDMDKNHSVLQTRYSSVRSYESRRSTRNFLATSDSSQFYGQNIPLRCSQSFHARKNETKSAYSDDIAKKHKITFCLDQPRAGGLNGSLISNNDNRINGNDGEIVSMKLNAIEETTDTFLSTDVYDLSNEVVEDLNSQSM